MTLVNAPLDNCVLAADGAAASKRALFADTVKYRRRQGWCMPEALRWRQQPPNGVRSRVM